MQISGTNLCVRVKLLIWRHSNQRGDTRNCLSCVVFISVTRDERYFFWRHSVYIYTYIYKSKIIEIKTSSNYNQLIHCYTTSLNFQMNINCEINMYYFTRKPNFTGEPNRVSWFFCFFPVKKDLSLCKKCYEYNPRMLTLWYRYANILNSKQDWIWVQRSSQNVR